MKLQNKRVFQPFGVLITAGVVLIAYIIIAGEERTDKEVNIDMVGYDWMTANINERYKVAEAIAKKFGGKRFKWYQIMDHVYSTVYDEKGSERSLERQIFFKRKVIDVARQIKSLTTGEQRSAQLPQEYVPMILDPLVESNPEGLHLFD
jgi:hypothetical protein